MICSNLGFYSGAGSIPGRWMTPKYNYKISIGSLNIDSAANWTISQSAHLYWLSIKDVPSSLFNYASIIIINSYGLVSNLIMGGLSIITEGNLIIDRYQARLNWRGNAYLYNLSIHFFDV